MRVRPNYRLKAGDNVILTQPARVDGYWYCPEYAPRGCWDSHYALPGTPGKVVVARTPKVVANDTECLYFANVDTAVGRVRVDHSFLRRVK